MPFPFPHQSKFTLESIGLISNRTPFVSGDIQPTPMNIEQLKDALSEDAEAYLYNALISFGAATHSIDKKIKNYGWAIVKLYYSVFYVARAKLAINQLAIVYIDKKPYLLSLSPSSSQILSKQTGRDVNSTHKLVLKLSKNFLNNTIINETLTERNQPILDWLMEQREMMNYTSSMMPDPNPPKPLKVIVQNEHTNIGKWLEIYKDDPTTYRIDEDHACIAYPFLLLLEVLHEFKTKVHPCNQLRNNMNYLKIS